MAISASPSAATLQQIDLQATSIAEAEWTKVGLHVGQNPGSYTTGPLAILRTDVLDKLQVVFPGASLATLQQASTYGISKAAATLGPGSTVPESGLAALGGTLAGAGKALTDPAALLGNIWSWIQARLPRLGLILAGAVLIVLSVVMLAKASGARVPKSV